MPRIADIDSKGVTRNPWDHHVRPSLISFIIRDIPASIVSPSPQLTSHQHQLPVISHVSAHPQGWTPLVLQSAIVSRPFDRLTVGLCSPSLRSPRRFEGRAVSEVRPAIDNRQRSMLAGPGEKMEKNENFEKLFLLPCFQWLILWKTGVPPKRGQFVCNFCTLSVRVLFRIAD